MIYLVIKINCLQDFKNVKEILLTHCFIETTVWGILEMLFNEDIRKRYKPEGFKPYDAIVIDSPITAVRPVHFDEDRHADKDHICIDETNLDTIKEKIQHFLN